MHSKPCHSHDATANHGCQQRCSPAATKAQTGSVIIWIVAADKDTAHLFVQRPGRKIEPMSMGCCCSKQATNFDELAKYLDTALACGHYSGLVLIGPEQALKVVKRLLSPAVHSRVIAEIVDDIAGKSAHDVAQGIAARMA